MYEILNDKLYEFAGFKGEECTKKHINNIMLLPYGALMTVNNKKYR